MKIIAFTGYKGSGKDTAAEAVLGETWKFADPLKSMIRMYLFYRGASEEEIEELVEGSLKEKPSRYFDYKTSRYAQQTLGTEWARELIASSIWVDTMEDRIRAFIKLGRKETIKITDVRFKNEAKMLQEKFNIPVVRIVRPSVIPDLSHPSEQDIATLPVNYEIHNTGTVKQLHKQIKDLIKDL